MPQERPKTIYRVQAPDGTIIQVEGPPGASDDEVIRQAQALTEPPKLGPIDRTMSFVNRGIARTVLFGGGADSFIAGMNAMGIPAATREPETLVETTAQGLGFAAGSLPAMLLPLGRLAQVPGIVGTMASRLYSPFVRSGASAATTTGVELVAGGGAGLAGGIAEEVAPDSPGIRTGAEIFGGMGAGSIPVLLGGAGRRAGPALLRSVRERYAPFTEGGARPRARAQLQQRSADPTEAALSAGKPTESGLTPSVATGEDNLIALERLIRQRDPAKWAEYRRKLKESEGRIRAIATEIGDPDSLERIADEAIQKAARSADEITPGRSPMEASSAYADELSAALTQARATESALWDIPNIRLTTANIRKRFVELSREPRAQADDMPAIARKLLAPRKSSPTEDALILGEYGETLISKESVDATTRFRDSEPVKELHGLYSKLREIARNARAGDTPNFNKARISDDLADAVWLDLVGAADNPTAVGQALASARDYSRQLNRTFRQGAVGRLLGYESTGKRRAGAEEALELSLGGRGGAPAAITSDELRGAVTFGGRAEGGAAGAIEDFLKQRFLDAANPSGTFSIRGAQAFLRRNRDLLSRTPKLVAQFDAALQNMQSADILQRLRPNIKRVFQSTTPRTAIRSLLTSLDVSEKSALRAGLVEYGLFSGKLDVHGSLGMSGERLQGLLKNPTKRGVFTEVFSPEQMKRLTSISDELTRLQHATGTIEPTIGGEEILEPASSPKFAGFIKYIAGWIGARAGAKIGSGSAASLRGASKTARLTESGAAEFMNRHSTRMITDALDDPEKYQALMTPVDAPAGPATVTLMRWLIRIARDAGEEFPGAIIPALFGTGAAALPGHKEAIRSAIGVPTIVRPPSGPQIGPNLRQGRPQIGPN